MKFAHAARDRVESRFQFGRNVLTRVAVDPVGAQSQRENAPARRSRQSRIERRGHTGMGHQTLQDQFLTGRDMTQIFAQRRNVVDPPCTPPSAIRLGNQRKHQSDGGQELPSLLEVGVKRARPRASRHHHAIGDPASLARADIEQIGAFRVAPHAARPRVRICHAGQGQ
jgi:hypothetical protein